MSMRQETSIIPQRTALVDQTGPLPGGTVGFVVEVGGMLHLTYSDNSQDSVPIAAGQTIALAAIEIDVDTEGSASGIHALVA